MNSCPNCGAPYDTGDSKCLYCGTALPAEPPKKERSKPTPSPANTQSAPARPYANPTPTHAPSPQPVKSGSEKDAGFDADYTFSTSNWKNNYTQKAKSTSALGLIITNTQGSSDPKPFLDAVGDYIKFKESHGVSYCLLDLATQQIANYNTCDIEDIISLLEEVYSLSVPEYLLIVGDSTVIPTMVWDNECGDDDETVPSDLAYITLDTESPWSGMCFDFNNVTRVGRIPSSYKTNFKEAIQYFNNTSRVTPYRSVNAFAYSALVWKMTSENEFAPLNPTLLTSPEYTSNPSLVGGNELMILLDPVDPAYNLLCFNLHGSDATHEWYGQRGGSYPEAFDISYLPKGSKSGYVVCTEACYGARPTVRGSGNESIVVHALMNNCLAFVGSSRIAYGLSDGNMSCADVIANAFTTAVANGLDAGSAFLSALTALCRYSELDEEEIKTLAEFSLYGDPSVVLIDSYQGKAKKSVSNRRCVSKPVKDEKKAVTLLSCDEGDGRVLTSKCSHISKSAYTTTQQAEIQRTAHSIRQAGQQIMQTSFSTMSDVEPKMYKVLGKDGYRAVYSKLENNIKTVVKLHMNDNGQVKKIYTSK